MRIFRDLGVALLACVLAACGGGGGGGGSGSSSSSSSGGGVARGEFTLSGTSATFNAYQGTGFNPAQEFTLTVTGSGVGAVGAAYAAGQTPAAWLSLELTGSGASYRLVVRAQEGFVPPGTYTAAFTVGTTDAVGTVLQTRVFNVTYNLYPRLNVNASNVLRELQFGDASRTEVLPLPVVAANREWTVTSDVPWIHVPAATQNGSATINATIDVTGLAPGNYSGSIRTANRAQATDDDGIFVTLIIAPASFDVTETSVLIGGTDGLEPLITAPVNFRLNTGQGVHPFTATVRTDSADAWMVLDRSAGTVGSAGTSINLGVNIGQLRGGTYTGELTISTNVYGTTFNETLPVTFNLEANRLVVSAAGVGLSRVPGRDVLTRDVTVFSTVRSTSTPWSATDDADWLSVTPSGVTGGALTLTANPAGLALETTHFANVTVISSDPRVENTQTIRVGLHLTAVAPVLTSVAIVTNYLATSPVEPLVAMSAGTVGLYNVYTGALVRDITTGGAQPGALAWSPDGRILYVYDQTNFVVRAIDSSNGQLIRNYGSTSLSSNSVGRGMTVMRPNGYPILVTPSARTYDLVTHQQYSTTPTDTNTPFAATTAYSLGTSPDQSLLVPEHGTATRVTRTALAGGGLRTQYGAVPVGTAGGRQGEACVSAAGDRIYTASGYPYNFPATSITTHGIVQVLPGDAYPNSMQCVWNGLVIGGATAYYADQDIYVYNGVTGALRGTRSSNGQNTGAYRDLRERGLAVSADGTRLMSSWTSNGSQGVYFHALPTPN